MGTPSGTPTRAGRRPESSSTSKLTGSAQGTTKSAGTTPQRRPPKLGGPKAEEAAEDVKYEPGDIESGAEQKIEMKEMDQPAEDVVSTVSQPGHNGGGRIGRVEAATGAVGKATRGDVAGSSQDTVGVKDTVGSGEGIQEMAETTVEGTKDTAEGAVEDAPNVSETVEGVKAATENPVKGVTDQARYSADDVKDTKSAAGGATDSLPGDLSILKGLKVSENGDIFDKQGSPIGKLEEGDPADLEGYEIGDDGEILDEDGDVVGRAIVLPEKIQDLAGQAQNTAKEAGEGVGISLPGLNVLDGLEVQENGDIFGPDGNILGRITEGDPADLVGMVLNADGEVLDEDGDVVGRAKTLPQKTGKEEVLDEDGDVVSGAEIAPEAAEVIDGAKADFIPETLDKAQDIQDRLKPDLTIVGSKKLNKKGNIIDDEGEVLATLVEGDQKACAGKIPNEKGEIFDRDGNLIGRVEVVQGEPAEEAMKETHPELVEQLEEAQKAADEAAEAHDITDGGIGQVEKATKAGPPDFSQLEGLKVDEKGEVVDENGDPIARLTEGELDAVRGKKINDKGEVLDKDRNVIGKVEFVPEAVEQGPVEGVQATPEVPETSILSGLKVNKKGQVLNEDGELVARLIHGQLADVAGKKLNDKGEVLDKDGNVIGKVERWEPEEASAEETKDTNLPPLSILEGLKVNKAGKVVNVDGNIVGEVIEGDAKKLWKAGITCDAEGQFWDNRGHVMGKAQTLPQGEKEEEAGFAGLDGLTVVAEGWVEDENGNTVGRIVDGNPKKLVGRAVDEDGDIIDKKGNVIGHAERYEEAEAVAEPEPEPVDLSELKGLSPNKQGNIIGADGVPVGRLVDGNPKELAGRKIDENGQIWNDGGKVVGRCELIPIAEREAKPEGPFAGLECIVGKDGFVEDHEGHVVGQVVEGDWKKLIGRAVDEDGDIIDKYGNVKGHVEPYEVPEEEVVVEDLSSLAGKNVNKRGKIVDEHGTIFGEVADGDVNRLVGCKVDGKGQIWSNDGKVIGHGRLIAGGDNGRAEGPFSNFDNTVVSKDGVVKDAAGAIVGRVIEGDPKKLVGRHVDDDGDIVDKNGNVIGRAERWEPEEKLREISPMAGLRVNKEGEVRDRNGDVVGRLTDGNLLACVGKEINDNGYVVDQDGNKLGECTLLENIPEEEEEAQITPEQLKEEEEREVARKIGNIIYQTLEKMEPLCKQITEASHSC